MYSDKFATIVGGMLAEAWIQLFKGFFFALGAIFAVKVFTDLL